jgi:hypothetical protein
MEGRVVSEPVPADHRECVARLKQEMAAAGFEVNVSDKRPGMRMPEGLVALDMRCPHGVSMWMEPTAEQLLAWAREGEA